MTARRLPRRLIVGASSAALLAGAVGFLPLLGSASAAACPTWTDPAGDSGVQLPVTGTPAGDADPTGRTSDDSLDLVSTTVSPDAAGGLVVQAKVKALNADGPSNTPGDEFVISFNAAGAAVKATLTRDVLEGDEAAALTGTATSAGKVVYDAKTSTVTGTFTADQVKAAVGKPLAGLKLDTFKTLVYGYTEYPVAPPAVLARGLGFPLTDQSTAPAALTYTDAGGCGDSAGGTPAPTGSGSPTASPTASPTPSPSPTATATPGALFDQPRKGCVQYKDPAGDADPTPTGRDNEDSLDVTQVNLKSPTDGSLQVFVKLANAGAGLNWPQEGGSYDVTTTIAGKAVVVAVDDTGAVTATTVGGAASTDLKPTAKLDAKNSNLVVTLPKDGLEKALKTTLARGTAVTGTSVETAVTTPARAFTADDAAGTTTAEKTYAYGDNTCFLPPAGVLAIDADPTAQYSDVTELFATLTDVDDSPVEGVTVTARLGSGKVVSALTDADGIADLRLPVTLPAGATTITTAFAGNDVVGATKAVTPFKVVAEKTVLKAVAVMGGVKATLLDDDKHPVVGRPVLFTIGSRKVLVKTNAQGLAAVAGLAKGTAVKVGFAAVPGYYLATPTYTVKAL